MFRGKAAKIAKFGVRMIPDDGHFARHLASLAFIDSSN